MEKNERTKNALIEHCQKYPLLGIQDVFKFIYQSAFGCGHFVPSAEFATEWITEEYEETCGYGKPVAEPLDGNYSRVPLAYINKGLSAATLGKLFAASANKETEGTAALTQKLNVARELIENGLLPFEKGEFNKAAAEWERAEYPPVHHTDAFKEEYRPSYRVIANSYLPYLDLFAVLDKLLQKGRVILAVEGSCASGKTTLCGLINEIYDCTVFHMDDFFLRPEQRTSERLGEIGGNVDWERFLSEVLVPLKKGEAVNYRKFDCTTMSLAEAKSVFPKRLVVVEGVYSMRPELAEYYDFSVFLDISSSEQRARILRRNLPQMAQRFFKEWIPMENRYFSFQKVKERCDMIITNEVLHLG